MRSFHNSSLLRSRKASPTKSSQIVQIIIIKIISEISEEVKLRLRTDQYTTLPWYNKILRGTSENYENLGQKARFTSSAPPLPGSDIEQFHPCTFRFTAERRVPINYVTLTAQMG